MCNSNYWGTALSKIKDEYPTYLLSVRQLLANACSYAERNLKECGYILFSNNEKEFDLSSYKSLKSQIKGLKPYDIKSFNNLVYSLRGIHDYAYHCRYDKKVCLYKYFDSYTKLTNYTDYNIVEDCDDDLAELTLFGAIVIIGQFLSTEQATAVSQDFKSLFIKYRNPIYLDCKDKPSSERALKKVLIMCSRNTSQFVNVEGEVKKAGYDTNSLIRRFIGCLFDKIEEKAAVTNNFKDSLLSLNINDFELIDKVINVRNWYCHGGYVFDNKCFYEMTPSFLIEVISDLSKCDITDDIKDVIKNIANEWLRSLFDMVAKYSIKLTDNKIILDGIKNKKYCWLSHRITNFNYNNPYRTNFYSDKDFERLMEMANNKYTSNFNNKEEFHGYRRNFSTKHIQFVTLKSKSLMVYNSKNSNGEFTIINPLLFSYDTDEKIQYTTINDMKLEDILPKDSNEIISHITIDLDTLQQTI